MKSDGTPWRPLVHVEDMARAFLAARGGAPASSSTTRPSTSGPPAENYRIRDVAEIVEAVVSGSVVRFADGAGPDLRNYRVDCDKLADVLPAAGAAVDGRARASRQLYEAYVANGLTARRPRRHPTPCASSASRRCRPTAASTPTCAGTRRRDAGAHLGRRRRRPSAGRARCRSCGGDRAATVPRPRRRPRWPMPSSTPRPSDQPEDRFPARASPSARTARWSRSSTRSTRSSSSSTTTSTSRRGRDQLLDHAAPARRAADRRPRASTADSLVVELGQQRRLPAAELRRRGHPRARHRPRARPGRGGQRRRRPDRRRSSSASTWPAGCVAEGQHGRRDHRQQRDGPRARPQRLRARAWPTLLADDGVITVENPYVRDLVDHVEFDTIYHEHFCYFSCTAVDRLVRRHGLFLNHVEYFPDLHGGTLRWTHRSGRRRRARPSTTFLADEAAAGVDRLRLLRRLRPPGRATCGRACWTLLARR